MRWAGYVVVVGCCLITACRASAPLPFAPPSNVSSARIAAGRYRAIDLGGNFVPARVNDRDVIVGERDGIAYLYENGTITSLGTYPGDTSSIANDINDAGTIVGQSSKEPYYQHAVEFHLGGLPTLLYTPTSQTPDASATAINAAGEIVGWIGGVYACGFKGAVFHGSGATVVPNDEYAVDVNDNGTITGFANAVGVGGCNGESTAYEYHPNRPLPFPANEAGVGGVIPTDIGDDGTIVGSYDYCNVGSNGCDIGGNFECTFRRVDACGFAGYVYRNGVATSIYSPRADDACLALNAINRRGEIVGMVCRATYHSEPTRAVIVDGPRVVDLNSLLPANCSLVLRDATDVNARGVIVGTATVRGALHGFMLLPRV